MSKIINFLAVLILILSGTGILIAQETESPNGYLYPIQGKVYLDKNGNGKLDSGEKGISGIGISDGKDVILSAKDGSYTLPNWDQSAKILFVSIPRDYQKTNQFYAVLSGITTKQYFDFGLIPSKEKDRSNFRFVQTTDIHISGPKDEQQFIDCIKELNNLSEDVVLVVATGDLINKGDYVGQFESYLNGIKNSKHPWYNVFGNHDANDFSRLATADFTKNYRHYLGPDYYSFDYSDYHFVILNSIKVLDRQKEWEKKDLEILGKGKKLIFFQHYPPKPEQIEELKQYGAKAIISGHWHSNKITDHEGLVNINTPTFRFGGIDMSPAGFRILEIKNDTLSSVYKIGGQEHRLAITYPSPDLEIHEDHLHLAVNAYDSYADVTAIDFEILTNDKKPVTGQLKQETEWTWTGDLTHQSVKKETYGISVTVKNDQDEKWVKKSEFKVFNSPIIPSKPNTVWMTFKGSPDRTGVSQDIIKPPFRLAWRIPTEGTLDFASPIIYARTVYISVKDRNGLDNNGILAVDAVTGEKLWFTRTDSEINHAATAYEGKIFGVTVGGKIYALDSKSGEIQWTYILDGNGTDRWIYAAPVVSDGNLYIGSAARFASLDPHTGSVHWQKSYGSDWISSLSSPAMANGKFFMGAIWNEYSCFAGDLKTGEVIWNYKLQGLHTSPVAYNGKVFVADLSGKLICLSEDSGTELWNFELGKGWAVTVPTVTDDMVIAGSSSGTLHAVNTETGKSIWQFNADSSLVRMSPYRDDYSSVFSSAIISGDLVYIGCSDGHLYCLEKNTGQKIWSYYLGVPIVSTPAISGNTLYFGAYDGNIYALTSQYQ